MDDVISTFSADHLIDD